MTYLDLYKLWIEQYPLKDIIPPMGYQVEVPSFEEATKNKEFNSPYTTTGLNHDITIWKKHGVTFPHKSNEGKLILGVYKTPKINYRHAIARTELLFPHLGREWETYIMPPQEVLESCIHPFEYTRACDLTLEKDYSIVLPPEISETRKKYLEERKCIYRKDLTLKDWLEIGSLKPIDIAVCQIILADLDEFLWSDLIKRLRKYPNFGAIALGHDPDRWPALFHRYKKVYKKSQSDEPVVTAELTRDKTNIVVPGLAPNEDYFTEENEDFDNIEVYKIYQDQLGLDDYEEIERPPPEPPPIQSEMDAIDDYLDW